MENLIVGLRPANWFKVALAFVWLAFHPAIGVAQPSSQESPGKLAFVLPTLLDRGIAAAGPILGTYIQQYVAPNFVSLNSAVAVELSNLPIPSAASAFSYSYDPASGGVQRTVQSYGPILTERADTLGRNSLYFAITYQRFLFDHVDDLKLGGVNVTAPLPAGVSPPQAFLNLNGSIGLKIDQVAAYFTAGLTPWLDVSYALSIMSSSMSVRGGGTLTDASGHVLVTLPTQLIGASATGLGDGVARAKARLFKRRNLGIAFATDVRFPTGDELNYHGAGAYGVKPFFIASLKTRSVSPHLNVGYQWNGVSFLGSQYTGIKHTLPGQIFYAAGFDAGLSPKLTASLDFLDQIIIKGQRTFIHSVDTGSGPIQLIEFPNSTRQEINAAIGLKAELQEHVVMTGNLLLSLNQAGLRARVVPLVGIAYVF